MPRNRAALPTYTSFACLPARMRNAQNHWILNTCVLNERAPAQKKIGLNALLRLGARKVDFAGLHGAVAAAAARPCME